MISTLATRGLDPLVIAAAVQSTDMGGPRRDAAVAIMGTISVAHMPKMVTGSTGIIAMLMVYMRMRTGMAGINASLMDMGMGTGAAEPTRMRKDIGTGGSMVQMGIAAGRVTMDRRRMGRGGPGAILGMVHRGSKQLQVQSFLKDMG